MSPVLGWHGQQNRPGCPNCRAVEEVTVSHGRGWLCPLIYPSVEMSQAWRRLVPSRLSRRDQPHTVRDSPI